MLEKKKQVLLTLLCICLITFSGCINNINQKPTITITYPHEGETLSGIVNITGTAFDSDGTVEEVAVFIIKIVDILVLDVYGTFNWYSNWDTTWQEDGEYRIHIRSRDDDGDYSESVKINVTVNSTILV